MPIFKLLYALLGVYWLAVVGLLLLWRRHLYGSTLELVPRPAAHSCELELRKRYFDLVFWALIVAFVPTYTTLSYARFRGPAAVWVFTIAGGVLTLLGLVNAYRHIKAIHRLRTGRDRQLAVARELAGIASFEHRLLHDLPADNAAFINHVLVGPSGVFAIHTGGGPATQTLNDSGKVVVDGRYLRFSSSPPHIDRHSVANAANAAKWLQSWLIITVRVFVEVEPVLVLPGWRIEYGKPNNKVTVLNEGELRELLRRERVLQPTQIHAIAEALEQRSRIPTAVARPPQPTAPGSASSFPG